MRPYLSIVVAGRNDDYGGDFLGRMRNFVSGVDALARWFRLPTELVVVDWNPPDGAPPLSAAFDWPHRKQLTVRLLTVPRELHERLPNSEKMPIFEYIAKNVGIRRAMGEFVLATNPDLLMNVPLMWFLSRRQLAAASFYRVNRYDVVPPIPEGSYRAKLAFCSRKFTRVNVWGESISFAEPPRGRNRLPSGIERAVRLHFEKRPETRDTADPIRALHTNAAGDFLLMHRERWHALLAYPEFHTSAHIDGWMCAIAASSGLSEVALPHRYRVYHQEHERAVDLANLEASTRPLTSWFDYADAARRMLVAGTPEIENDGEWGLASSRLPVVLVGA